MQAQYKHQFIHDTRQLATDICKALDKIASLTSEHVFMDFDGLLRTPDGVPIPPIPEDDVFLSGEHVGLTKDEYMAAISTMKRILNDLTKNQRSSLYKMRFFGQ
jgi:hypothetical protein